MWPPIGQLGVWYLVTIAGSALIGVFYSLRLPLLWKPLFIALAFGFGYLAMLTGYIHTGRYAVLSFFGATLCLILMLAIYWKHDLLK